MMALKVGKLCMACHNYHLYACMQTLLLVHHLMMVGRSSYIMALIAPQSSILLYNRYRLRHWDAACMIYNQSFVHFRWSQLSRLCHRSQS